MNRDNIINMSKADEMFNELGYEKFDNHPDEEKEDFGKWTTQDCRVIEYRQTATIRGKFYTLFIRFHIEGKRVECGGTEKPENSREFAKYRNPIFNAAEIQAINEKCKELGWL